jgi:hypothetical protein
MIMEIKLMALSGFSNRMELMISLVFLESIKTRKTVKKVQLVMINRNKAKKMNTLIKIMKF